MFGLNIDPLNPKGDPGPQQLHELGVKTVRLTFKSAAPNALGFYRQRVQDYAAVGIRSLLILTNESVSAPKPPWDAADSVWQPYIGELATVAAQVAQQYNAFGVALQIWNEPDHLPKPGYEPTLSPARYAAMLRRVHTAVRAASPSTTLVTAGLVSGNPIWLREVLDTLGGQRPFDAVAVHPYGQRPAPDWPDPNWGFGNAGHLLLNYHLIGQRPIWVTEIGTNSDDHAFQAEYLRRFCRAIADRIPEVEQLLWFCYSDGMVDKFGIMDANQQPKAAAVAFRDVTRTVVQAPTPVLVGTNGGAPPPPPTPPAAPAPHPQIDVAMWLTQLDANPDSNLESADCLAACVAMVARHYGHAVTVNDVVRALGRPASSLGYHILDPIMVAAQQWGLHFQHAGMMSAAALRAEMERQRPLIALLDYASLPSRWQFPRHMGLADYDNGHFVVVVGYENGRVHYLDPFWQREAQGRIWMPEAPFLAAWSKTKHFRVARQGLRVARIN